MREVLVNRLGRLGLPRKSVVRLTEIKLQGDYGEIVSLQFQTSLCFELKEKFKCIEYIGKDEKWADTSP